MAHEKTENLRKLFKELSSKIEELDRVEEEYGQLNAATRNQTFEALADESIPEDEHTEITIAAVNYLRTMIKFAVKRGERQERFQAESDAFAAGRGIPLPGRNTEVASSDEETPATVPGTKFPIFN